jgi:hypothetical protein
MANTLPGLVSGFLASHARAVACIARDRGVRLRDIATMPGITERTASGSVPGLTAAGYAATGNRTGRNLPLVPAGGGGGRQPSNPWQCRMSIRSAARVSGSPPAVAAGGGENRCDVPRLNCPLTAQTRPVRPVSATVSCQAGSSVSTPAGSLSAASCQQHTAHCRASVRCEPPGEVGRLCAGCAPGSCGSPPGGERGVADGRRDAGERDAGRSAGAGRVWHECHSAPCHAAGQRPVARALRARPGGAAGRCAGSRCAFAAFAARRCSTGSAAK